ncbi:homoserine kinase [Thalassolituus maritimus]|uniref:Homoserine kinase n=1 Tax=Thalassolituus maritimus TaxID=484498 RepID=A0ABP9ZXD5_9GAMM
MAVYTSLTAAELTDLLSQYDVGELVAYTPISAGIENSNYAVTTSQREYVLTLFEHHAPDEVRNFVRLARHLGTKAMSVPSPVEDASGVWLHSLKNKPTILCQRFAGSHPDQLSEQQCEAIGRELAEFHLASSDLPDPRHDERGYDWWQSIASELSTDLNASDKALLTDELAFQQAQRAQWCQLPHGWIHADLFHDNALFDGDELTAILDLYNACEGAWLYDLAIVANDWCASDDSGLDPKRFEALVIGYQSVRPLSEFESGMWNTVLRGAALRFWLSRLLATRMAKSRSEELPAHKQPTEYRDRLRWHRAKSLSKG